MFYGLNDLDEKLNKIIDADGGFFFEAGANDGRSQSNTLFFEESRGWRGILVEPIPGKFLECAANRPKAIIDMCALVPSGWPSDKVDLVYCNLMTITQGSWPTREEEIRHIETGTMYLNDGDRPRPFKAHAATIDALLKKHRIDKLDLMSIDLEGFELQALHGADFDRVRPKWLLVEERKPAPLIEYLSPWYALHSQLTNLDFLFQARTA